MGLIGQVQVAQAKGDYRAASYDAWSMEEPLITALQSSATTWVRTGPRTNACQNVALLLQSFTIVERASSYFSLNHGVHVTKG